MSPTSVIGSPFIELHSVDSTNNYAMAMLHAGMAQHGTAVFTHEQTKGKGQRNKQWFATKGENIILSVIVNPFDLTINQAFLFSMAVSVGVHRFFNKYTANDCSLKWPNDLYWRDRKAGGILIENVFQGNEWKYAIAGIGLNINQVRFDQVASKAVSLKQITGKTFNTVSMAKELIEFLKDAFEQLIHQPETIYTDYSNALFRKDEKVRLKKDNRIFEARIKGVTKDGLLITEHQIEELFRVGEVEWLL